MKLHPKKKKTSNHRQTLPAQTKSTTYCAELDCSWNNLTLQTGGSDPASVLFQTVQLPALQLAFEQGASKVSWLDLLNSPSIQTQGLPLRVYHVAYQAVACEPFVFIRNETTHAINNWAACLNPHQAPKPGDFIDYPAQGDASSWGGLRADLFLLNGTDLISSSLGTHAWHSCTTGNTRVYKWNGLDLYYIELQFTKNARYAFALWVKARP